MDVKLENTKRINLVSDLKTGDLFQFKSNIGHPAMFFILNSMKYYIYLRTGYAYKIEEGRNPQITILTTKEPLILHEA